MYQGRDWAGAKEALATVQNLKGLPKHLGIKINDIFMQYFGGKMNAKHSIMSKILTLKKAGLP